MKTLLAALLVVLAAAPAHAGGPPSDGADLVTDGADLVTAGGVLVGVSGATALAATAAGTASLVSGLCGLGDTGCSDSVLRAQDTSYRAAIVLSATSALSAAIGIPLLVAGKNRIKAQRASLRFGLGVVAGRF